MAAVNNYSRLDRMVHRIAFLSPAVQITAAEIEDKLFKKAAAAPGTEAAPVFVTSLPRAGTTILLSALYDVPELSAHLYRDMPFVMAPILWSRLNGAFRKQDAPQERAHGDGIEIGYDSPEAFEEVIWRAFWPEKYEKNRIRLWTEADALDEAQDFFIRHFRKIVGLRQGAGASAGRYLSKNNGNITRLGLILSMFPDAKVVVPVRHPLSHAASLLRQHTNFLDFHGQDPFVRRYMGDIGHYEFGALHRPIAFKGFADLARGRTPEEIEYWIAYWIAGMEHISRYRDRDRILIIGHEEMCNNGTRIGAELCRFLEIDGSQAAAIGAHFRPHGGPPPDQAGDAPELTARALDLYADMTQ